MTGAIFVSWGQPVRGRESKGLEVFGEALQYWTAQAKQGRIHGHKEYFAVTGNSSHLAGVEVIEGEVEELQRLLVSPETRDLTDRAQHIVENFSVTLTIGGSDQAVGEEVQRYVNVLQSMNIS
ncbi:MAG: hypothetical protein ACYDCC_05975 [Actinomycetota bacterium]